MKKSIFLLMSMLLSCIVWAQESVRPLDLVNQFSEKYKSEKIASPFKVNNHVKGLPAELKEYIGLDVETSNFFQADKEGRKLVEVDLPISRDEVITLELVQVNNVDNDYVITYPEEKKVKNDKSIHYRGVIKGNKRSIVALSVFENEVMGLISGIKNQNIVLGKVNGSTRHLVYLDGQIGRLNPFSCSTEDEYTPYTREELSSSSSHSVTNRASDKCVRLYIEVDYDVYSDFGSVSSTSNFVTGFMNQVMTLYANENISTSLSPLVIWNSQDPYTSTSTSGLLSQFQDYRTSFDGDLGQLIGYKGGGGVAAGFSGICNSNSKNSMSYSGIKNTYSNVPTFSWTVQVVTHEFGHTFGSRHTHACVWNGNGTAIDGCAGYVEGNCSQPANPSDGGTIMSYCHQTSAGINLANGFGTQPGNLIRNRVANGSCLGSCDGGGDGGGEDCTDNNFEIKLVTDNYPSETSWELKNASGVTVASGNGYQDKNATYVEKVCLPKGCYTFTIKDSYGDGICCSYGNGSYTVTVNGEEKASGGEFTSSEEVEICTEDTPQCIDTEIKVKTDNYPSETSWELKDAQGNVVETGGNYTMKNHVYSVTSCLAPGCYELTVKDSYGDGICCNYGEGYYAVYQSDNELLNEFGSFTSTVTKSFCVGDSSQAGKVKSVDVGRGFPPFTAGFTVGSPFSEVLEIEFSKTKEDLNFDSITIVDMTGHTVFKTSNHLSSQNLSIPSYEWKEGVYILNIIHGNQTKTVKVIKR